MGMEVDEAGRDDEAIGIDYLFGKAGAILPSRIQTSAL